MIRKLYIYCGVMFCLIAVCLTVIALQYVFISSDDTADSLDQVSDSSCKENFFKELEEAKKTNADVYAWLNIPGTNISYPVVQSSKSDTYYTNRDANRHYSSSGSIMSEHTYNGIDFADPVTVLNGNCMKSGAMFGSLQTYYASEDGLEKYKTIEIYFADKTLKYEVFAAVPYDARNLFECYDFSDSYDFVSFFDSIASIRSFNANIIAEEKPQYGDNVLILSTMLKGDSTQRYLVIAKLI